MSAGSQRYVRSAIYEYSASCAECKTDGALDLFKQDSVGKVLFPDLDKIHSPLQGAPDTRFQRYSGESPAIRYVVELRPLTCRKSLWNIS